MLFAFGKKKPQYYKGILIKADTGLHDQLAKVVDQYLPKRSRVLDAGCGEGALSARLFDMGYDVTPVDKDINQFCNYAELRPIQVDFDKPLAEQLGLFDAVMSVEVIEHLENPWNYIRELGSLLKSDGLMFLTTPNIENFLSKAVFLRTGRFLSFDEAGLSYGHINPLTMWELRLILDKSGFKFLDSYPGGTLSLFHFEALYLRANVFRNLLAPLTWVLSKNMYPGWCHIVVAKKKG